MQATAIKPDTMPMAKTQELEIESNPEKLGIVRDQIAEIAQSYGFSQSEIFDLQVAICEAVANAIEYGCGAKFSLSFGQSQDSIIVKIENKGPFIKRIPSPNEESYRGRGILLMLALMDHVTIDEFPDKVIVTLSKKLPTAATA